MYTKPNDRSYEPIQYMICSNCRKPALEEYWEWTDMDEDTLMCPNCCEEVEITEWFIGLPETASQQCLMCDGSGRIEGNT